MYRGLTAEGQRNGKRERQPIFLYGDKITDLLQTGAARNGKPGHNRGSITNSNRNLKLSPADGTLLKQHTSIIVVCSLPQC